MHSKGNHQKNTKTQPTEKEKIVANDKTDESLISKNKRSRLKEQRIEGRKVLLKKVYMAVSQDCMFPDLKSLQNA